MKDSVVILLDINDVGSFLLERKRLLLRKEKTIPVIRNYR